MEEITPFDLLPEAVQKNVGLYKELEAIWKEFEPHSTFSCVEGCNACCGSAVTMTRLEYALLKSKCPEPPNQGLGCPFRTKKGCAVYEYRPLNCRLFGHYAKYDVPTLVINEVLGDYPFEWTVVNPSYCTRVPKKNTTMSQEKFTELVARYEKVLQQSGFVIVGLFKSSANNKGLRIINELWKEKFDFPVWERE